MGPYTKICIWAQGMEKMLPGALVGGTFPAKLEPGSGLYRHSDGTVRANIRGVLAADGSHVVPSGAFTNVVPVVGQVVLGRVMRLTSRFAVVDIVAIDSPGIWLEEPYKATLRVTDLWPIEMRNPPALMSQAVRPGDIIRCLIIGVGDSSAGFLVSLSTDTSFGVVYALCAASGQPLVALSGTEMTCPVTGVCESRHAAQPKDK